MPDIVVVLHNIRSTHNVGSIFRTSEGLGVKHIICSGYTPYPRMPRDTRLPHIVDKLTGQIKKTALGAETMVDFSYSETLDLTSLVASGYKVIGLEQTASSIPLSTYVPPEKMVLILGEEVRGISPEIVALCDDLIEITMRGKKESFNVSVAAGIALYTLTIDS